MPFAIFDDVRHLLVSHDNPAREEGDLDYERCAALHNAIVEHGWTASGRSPDNPPMVTAWEKDPHGWEQDIDRLHPSMIEFLKRAYDTNLPETEPIYDFVSREYKFFYFLEGLIGPQGYEAYHLVDLIGEFPGHYLTLYTPNDRLGSQAQGLIYNQQTHECLVNFANTDFNPVYKVLPWERLETVLSVYIDMIESEKVVCLHNNVERPSDFKLIDLGGDAGQQWRPTQDRPDTIFADPITGVTRHEDAMFGPWIVQPHTEEVLKECLRTWDLLVQAIEEKMPTAPGVDTQPEYGLANEELLESAGITEDFPKQVLLRARKPRFNFIAPGLRLLTSEEIVKQPFKSMMARQADLQNRKKMPVLLFRGDDTCKASQWFPHPYKEAGDIPTGLYLEGWTQDDLVPFTDATRLLLPFTIGGEDTWARTANNVSIDGTHDDLYQIGVNPFASYHGVSLLAVLQNFYAHIYQGDWSVDENGVSGTIDTFREAEDEEHWENMGGLRVHCGILDATYTDSVVYLKAVFASCFFFDIGLFMPKASITAFYWWLIPKMFKNLRVLLLIVTIYLGFAATTSFFVDLLLCSPIHYNWSLDYDEQGRSIWNSYRDFWIEWMLNFSTDVFLFCIPFFIIKSLKLRQRQKFGLIGVFSLGLITMAISFARFMIYTVSDYDLGDNDGAVMCTAEMCTSLIVASLPGLKVLITRGIKNASSTGSSSGYNKPSNTPNSQSRIANLSSRLSRPAKRPSFDDSEFELISVGASNKQFSGKTASTTGDEELDDTQITVKHDFTVEHGRDSKRGSYQNTTSLPFV
ncbi:hypothetical protein KCU67_g370, partial [Aureobasidium melanogenum]